MIVIMAIMQVEAPVIVVCINVHLVMMVPHVVAVEEVIDWLLIVYVIQGIMMEGVGIVPHAQMNVPCALMVLHVKVV